MSKRWTVVFKVLGNENRIKIIQLLSHGKSFHVTDISEELGISLKATSQHLIILQNLGVLESVGQQGHVYYTLNENMPKDIKNGIKLFA